MTFKPRTRLPSLSVSRETEAEQQNLRGRIALNLATRSPVPDYCKSTVSRRHPRPARKLRKGGRPRLGFAVSGELLSHSSYKSVFALSLSFSFYRHPVRDAKENQNRVSGLLADVFVVLSYFPLSLAQTKSLDSERSAQSMYTR